MKSLFLLILVCLSHGFIFAQTILTIEGTSIENTLDGTWSGVNIQRSVATIFTYQNNSITSVNTAGYMLQAGDETPGSKNNNLEGEVITGNKFTWNGTDMTSITHGVFTGYNINAIIKYNYLDKVPMSIIRKSNGMTDVSGVVAYNIIKSPNVGVVIKGMNGVKIYNNTFYQDRTTSETYRGLIDIYENDDVSPAGSAVGTKIKNNIFYIKHKTANINIINNSCLTDFESDYNIFYCEEGTPVFVINGVHYTFNQWQSLGYDKHSVVVNPNFIDFVDFVPSARLDYGTSLGDELKAGLSVGAIWGKTDPAIANQNGSWQVGARLFAAKVYYLSPSGNDDTGNGTIGSPWFSLNKAWKGIAAGDLIFMRGGTYAYNTQQMLRGRNGTSENYIKVWAYPGETPVLTKGPAYTVNQGLFFKGDYVHFKGLDISGYTQISSGVCYAFRIENSSHNIFELLNIHHNGAGLNIANYDVIEHATDNLVLNCDAHHNQDPLTSDDPYGNADGFECSWISHPEDVNTFRGCRSWWNTDDGFDLWASDGMIVIEDCQAFWNGYIPGTFTSAGDGNGFKLGKSTLDLPTEIKRKVTNCLAFKNKMWGFQDNGALCNMELYNNTAYNNGDGSYGGFHFNRGGVNYFIKNNIAYANSPNEKVLGKLTNVSHNSWDKGVTVTEADFVSLDSTGVTGVREGDGGLPKLDFLKLSASSNLIGAGVDVGLPYLGLHPDMGAYEFVGENHPPTVTDQSFYIDESSPDKTIVGVVVASDPDMDQRLKYSIVSGNTDQTFSINDSTGVLSVAKNTPLTSDFVLTVKVQDNEGLTSQATIRIDVVHTDIQLSGTDSSIRIRPNPVSNELIIELEGKNDIEQRFTIMNGNGAVILKGTLSQQTVISMANFSSGTYILKLQKGKRIEFKKIIKM